MALSKRVYATMEWRRPRPTSFRLHAFGDGSSKSLCGHYADTFHGVPVPVVNVEDLPTTALCSMCSQRAGVK